jgi:hypothetical protein
MAQEISDTRTAQHVDVDPFDFADLGIRPQHRISRETRFAGVNHHVLSGPPDHALVGTYTRADHIADPKSAGLGSARANILASRPALS